MSKNMLIPWSVVRELVHKWSVDSSQLKICATISGARFSFFATSEGFTADELRFRPQLGIAEFSLKISALRDCSEFELDSDDCPLPLLPVGFKVSSGIRITMSLGGDALKLGPEGEVIIVPLTFCP